jgi:preprotein translocase subunit SecG
MNQALNKMAIAIGGLFFVISLVIGYLNDVSITVALSRATLILLLTTFSIIIFLRFLTSLLIQFVSERVKDEKRLKLEAKEAQKSKAK